MATLIDKTKITATNVDEVIKQTVDQLLDNGVDAYRDSKFAPEFLEGFGPHDFSTREVQRFEVLGEMDGDWQITIRVKVWENHSSVTDVCVYTVTAFAD